MVMQRPTETIATNVGLGIEETEQAQERVTHALIANGNLHLILRNPEGALDDAMIEEGRDGLRVLPMQRSVDQIWEKISLLIHELPAQQKILLDMVFDEELDANTILERCETLSLALPVTPRSGTITIHTIYQSIDALLTILGEQFELRFPEVLHDAQTWLDNDDLNASISIKGLKALLKNMGIKPPPPRMRTASNKG